MTYTYRVECTYVAKLAAAGVERADDQLVRPKKWLDLDPDDEEAVRDLQRRIESGTHDCWIVEKADRETQTVPIARTVKDSATQVS